MAPWQMMTTLTRVLTSVEHLPYHGWKKMLAAYSQQRLLKLKRVSAQRGHPQLKSKVAG